MSDKRQYHELNILLGE